MFTPDDVELDCDLTLRTLAKRIDDCLKQQRFYVMLEDEVERCWPSRKIGRTARDNLIHHFAEVCGWRVFIGHADSGSAAAILWEKS